MAISFTSKRLVSANGFEETCINGYSYFCTFSELSNHDYCGAHIINETTKRSKSKTKCVKL